MFPPIHDAPDGRAPWEVQAQGVATRHLVHAYQDLRYAAQRYGFGSRKYRAALAEFRASAGIVASHAGTSA
jgi:hypothetical protein